MPNHYDCVVAGTCVLDLLVRPVALESPIGGNCLFEVDPIVATSGGVVCNSGTAMAKLGCSVAALACVGDDVWGRQLVTMLQAGHVDPSGIEPLPGHTTSTTAVLVSESGERTFAHHPGAGAQLARRHIARQTELIMSARCLLLGYYGLLPQLESDLPRVLSEIRRTGCLLAMDAGGDGGTMQHLEPVLPLLDYYVPSFVEATGQTGEREPERILRAYRSAGAKGVIGLKLGDQGALISEATDSYIEIPCAVPLGPVVDTTGAGDAFYAGLLAGVLKGLSLADAARLGAATAACSITAFGASAGVRGFGATATLAGITQ